MKIVTAKQQGKALMYLTRINEALVTVDEMKSLKAIEDCAELAYIVGGIEMMKTIAETINDEPQTEGSDQ